MVSRTAGDHVGLDAAGVELKPGDGVVFDTGGDTDHEQGGRIFEIRGNDLYFEHGKIDFPAIPPGTRVWKTDDPALNRELRKSYAGKLDARRENMPPLDFAVSGRAGGSLVLECRGVVLESGIPLEPARTRPLTEESLRAQLGKLGETPFILGEIRNDLEGDVILPLAELNRLRREMILRLSVRDSAQKVSLESVLPRRIAPAAATPQLMVLCRSQEQLGAALDCGIATVAVDFEDIRRYKDAVAAVREAGAAQIFLATPRIQKAGEEGFFKLIENAGPDGVLIRNVGGISHFAQSPLRRIGDFSLNVANPVTASVFHRMGIERATISHDLNLPQILALLKAAPPEWFELTIHHHMPMFHMEHCVFAAFLSEGTDHTNCGRPCDLHRVHLRDRVGMEHPLRADVGCRNTLFHAVPQSGAGFFQEFISAGLRHFRVELLEETADEARHVISAYQSLLSGKIDGAALWKSLKAKSQIGVTRGTYE
jgi:putative protease